MDGLDYVYSKGMDSVRFFFGVFIRRDVALISLGPVSSAFCDTEIRTGSCRLL